MVPSLSSLSLVTFKLICGVIPFPPRAGVEDGNWYPTEPDHLELTDDIPDISALKFCLTICPFFLSRVAEYKNFS
jgi:hypothetical protein